jgi:hypothetical protein
MSDWNVVTLHVSDDGPWTLSLHGRPITPAEVYALVGNPFKDDE